MRRFGLFLAITIVAAGQGLAPAFAQTPQRGSNFEIIQPDYRTPPPYQPPTYPQPERIPMPPVIIPPPPVQTAPAPPPPVVPPR